MDKKHSLLLAFLVSVLFMASQPAHAYDYYQEFYFRVVAAVSPTGAGKVYVTNVTEAPSADLYADTSSDTGVAEKGYDEGDSIPTFGVGERELWALPNPGCTFLGWATAENPDVILSTDTHYTAEFNVYSTDTLNRSVINYIAKFTKPGTSLSMENVTIAKGQSVQVPVIIDTDSEVRDVQLDIFVPSGITISDVKIGTGLNHSVHTNKLYNGALRVIVASLSGNTIKSGTTTLFTMTLSANRGSGGELAMNNIVVSDNNSNTLNVNDACFTVDVQSSTPSAWAEPVAPAFEPMATDGKTVQYLYNVEAKSFFLGANDWQTRASVSKTKGYQVKMTPTEECWDGYGHKQHWAINNYVETRGNWYSTFADSWNGIWVDGSSYSINSNNWVVIPQDSNMYKIYNCGISYDNASYTLGLAEIFEGEKGNTRLWLYDPYLTYWVEETGDEAPVFQGEFYDKWAFVSPAEYEAYIVESIVYEAAMKLQDALEEAKAEFPGANFADADAVFNNTSSSAEELDEARTVLVPLAISKYQAEHVSADDPQDMTRMVPNYDFELSSAGWKFTTNASNRGLATNKANQKDYPGTTMSGQFLESWHYDAYAGNMYTTLNNMPSGLYKVEMDAFANSGKDTWVYANDAKTRTGGVDSYGNTGLEMGDIPYRFTVYTVVGEEGHLELGLSNASVCCNWIGIDNVSLMYYGNGDDAYKLWYQNERAAIISAIDAIVGPDTKYDKNQKEIFQAALAAGDAASTKDEIISAIEVLKNASDATITSIEAYSALQKLIEEYRNDDTDYCEGPILYFFDLIDTEDVDAGQAALEELAEIIAPENMVEVSPIEVLTECTYSADEIYAYIQALKLLHNECANKSLGEGADVSNMLTNPKFTDPYGNGWTRENGSITWRGGFHAFPVAESYHSAFDFYQEIDVPNGIYSLSLNGFCRPDDGETEPAAEIYLNETSAKFQSLEAGALNEKYAADGMNCYLSHDAVQYNPIFAGNLEHSSPANNTDRWIGEGYIPDGMEGASVAFSAGRYETKVYALVENGKIKVGARCSSTHQWVLWGNFTLVYEGETDEAMRALAESFLNDAQQYLDENGEYMSEPAMTSLADAIDDVVDSETAEEIKEAVKNMNAALEDAKANVAAIHEFMKAQEEMWEAAGISCNPTDAALIVFERLCAVEFYPLTTSQIIEYTTEFRDCAAMLRIPDSSDASDDNPVDFTQVIINPDFEAGQMLSQPTGWTLVKKEGASGNYQTQRGIDWGMSMEFWSNTNGSGTKFDFYQDIKNLPAGTYELNVDAANSLNGQYIVNDGRAYIYAAKDAGKINYVNADPIDIQEESCVDMYDNYSVIVNLNEGETLRIGATNVGDLAARWVMVDNFRLTYYGKNSYRMESQGIDVHYELTGEIPDSSDVDRSPIVGSPSFSISNGQVCSEGNMPSLYVRFKDIRNVSRYSEAIISAAIYNDTTEVATATSWNTVSDYHFFNFDGIDSLSAGSYKLMVYQIYLADCDTTLDVDFSVNFTVKGTYKLNVDLAEGWNWMSINTPDTWMDVLSLSDMTDCKVDYVADQLNDNSFSYNNYEWYGELWEMNNYSAYKVHTTGECSLAFRYPENEWWSGESIVNPGWNWISYRVAYPQKVSDAMAFYQPADGDIIKSLDNTAIYSEEYGWVGDFTMVPGEGYLYKSESNIRNFLEYNWGEEVAVNEVRARSNASGNAVMTYNPHLYRDNMAVIATVGDDTFGNFTVAAMAGNECRGISKMDSGFQVVTVHGEKRGEEIAFYLIDNVSGNIYLANETVNFNGASLGTLYSPVTLTVGALIGDTETGIKGAQIAGASNNGVYTIQGVKTNGLDSKGVYIKNGKKVIVK